MNLIFMRHGEATDNVREVISDKEIGAIQDFSGRTVILIEVDRL